MDIIDDTEWAFDSYLKHEFPTDAGEQYLRFYGVMQALFVQQDALSDLIKAIHPSKKIEVNDVLIAIREARNASVGHPTQLKRKGVMSAHAMIRNSMGKDGFSLHSYPTKNGNFSEFIPVCKLIEKQRIEATRILTEVVNDLRDQERAHREQFKDIKLVKTLDQVSYAFEKIGEELGRRTTFVLGGWGVKHLQSSLDQFSKLLQDRGLGVEAFDSINYLYDEIRHPLTELTKYVESLESEIRSPESAEVFVTALRKHFDELRAIAIEIDDEYASEPDPIVPPPPTENVSVTIKIIGE